MNACIKIRIKSCNELDYKSMCKELSDIQYLVYNACNRAMTYFYSHNMEKSILLSELNAKYEDKDLYGKSFSAWVENRMNEIMSICHSGNVARTRRFVEEKYKSDVKNGLLKGQRAISNFKRNMPIIIHPDSYSILQGNKGYEISVSLFNRKYQQENNVKRQTFLIDKIDSSKEIILNKLINGLYKRGSAQILKDNKNKWYLIISFSFEPELKTLDKNRILGVDIGIVNTATMQIWDSNKNKWDWIKWNKCVIDGRELIHYRQKTQQRYYNLQKNCKVSSTGRTGHGITAKMKPINSMRDKISNFRDTINHKYSKYIVDFASNNNCGIIQMEDLSGFSELQNEKFLKEWSYYDLQNKIIYKAKKIGIDVKFINPQYTSKRCSNCGCIDNANRDCKNNQAKFKCVICGHEENADINAAKNISLPNINEIIEEQLKIKG